LSRTDFDGLVMKQQT